MIIQATRYGTAEQEEPFAFTYSGDFTDERVDGIGDVTLNTSGTLTVTSGKATVQAYILGAGGGAAGYTGNGLCSGGGGGGNQTVTVELAPGTYEIVIGTGGAAQNAVYAQGSNGGDTTAFGYTSTGGYGGSVNGNKLLATAGSGGTPNGNSGTHNAFSGTPSGGSPNGGGFSGITPLSGGDGLVRITFS